MKKAGWGMLFFNVIKMSFTDLAQKTYDNSFWFNDDKSGYVYASEKERQELVFYPVNNHKDLQQITEELSKTLWKKNLFYNIMPFVISMFFSVLMLFLLEPFGMTVALSIAVIIFLFVLYLSKISFSVFMGVKNYRIFLNENFKVLPVYQGLGKHSTVDDAHRARISDSLLKSPLSNNSELLANSHFIQTRMYEEKHIVQDPHDARGVVGIFEKPLTHKKPKKRQQAR